VGIGVEMVVVMSGVGGGVETEMESAPVQTYRCPSEIGIRRARTGIQMRWGGQFRLRWVRKTMGQEVRVPYVGVSSKVVNSM
jgi:hypothetical protein